MTKADMARLGKLGGMDFSSVCRIESWVILVIASVQPTHAYAYFDAVLQALETH
jgi:hypothetical protein